MMLDTTPMVLSPPLTDTKRSGSNPLTIRCPACHMRLTTAFELRKHAIAEHLSSLDIHNRMEIPCFACNVFTCAVCGAVSSECAAVEEHFRLNHSGLTNDPVKKCAILAQKVKLVPCTEDSSHGSSDSEDDDHGTMMGIRIGPENTFLLNGNLTPVTVSQPLTLSFNNLSSTGSPIKLCTSSSAVRSTNPTLSTVSFPSASQTATVPAAQPTTTNAVTTSTCTTAATTTTTPVPMSVDAVTTGATTRNSVAASTSSGTKPIRLPFQNWTELILRSDKKFMCMLCRRCVYSGRTEVVFHAVTRHLLANEIEHDLAHYARLSDTLKRQIGQYFADGMRIRSGVHYKDAKRVEAALFRSIELHLRYQPTEDTTKEPRFHKCSGCGTTFHDTQTAYSHVNEELRISLPEFMRARSCPWSLSTREEWVWCVPDLQIEPLPGKTTVSGTGGVWDPNEEVQLVLGDRIHKLGISRAADIPIATKPTTLQALAPSPAPRASTNTGSVMSSTRASVPNPTPALSSLALAATPSLKSINSTPTVSHNTVATAADVVKSLVAVAGLLQPNSVTCVSTPMGPATAAIPIAAPIFKIESAETIDQLVVRPG